MISILIPVYNRDITQLVTELHRQCVKLGEPFELLIYDDASTQRYKDKNRAIEGLLGINYVELSDNIGRSRIRNRLAKYARYDNLIFLDCDSKVHYKTFVKRYINALDSADVIYGGTYYSPRPPKNEKKYLHWKYGLNRESPAPARRMKRPYELLHSNNFMISRDVMRGYPFDESIEGYGYEDLEWAQRLAQNNITVSHIDNPVVHLGLKNTKDFIKDIDQSIDNLIALHREKKIEQSRLIRSYEKLQKWGIMTLCQKLLNQRKDQIYNRLFRVNTKLIYLDLYKLHYFAEAMTNERK